MTQLDANKFFGYSAINKAFRVFKQKTLNVEEIVHVIFYESSNTYEQSNVNDLSIRMKKCSTRWDSEDDTNIPKRYIQSPEPDILTCNQKQKSP